MAVTVTMDSDPEICRLGFGEIDAVSLLARTAVELRTTLNTRQAIRELALPSPNALEATLDSPTRKTCKR